MLLGLLPHVSSFATCIEDLSHVQGFEFSVELLSNHWSPLTLIRYTSEERVWLLNYVHNLEAVGIVESCPRSPYASNVVLVPKG